MAARDNENTHARPDPRQDDWESIALSRVARRVEELPALPPEAEDFGWESDVLLQLRRRLAAGE